MTQQISPQTISVNGIEPTFYGHTDTYNVVDLRNDSKPTNGGRRILWLKNNTGGAVTIIIGSGQEDLAGDGEGGTGHPLTSATAVPSVGMWGYNSIVLNDGDEMLLGPFPADARAGWNSYDDSMLVYSLSGINANMKIAWFELPA